MTKAPAASVPQAKTHARRHCLYRFRSSYYRKFYLQWFSRIIVFLDTQLNEFVIMSRTFAPNFVVAILCVTMCIAYEDDEEQFRDFNDILPHRSRHEKWQSRDDSSEIVKLAMPGVHPTKVKRVFSIHGLGVTIEINNWANSRYIIFI